MNTIHEQVATPRVNKSAFDLSHEVKGSYNFGKLYPMLLEEVMPNENWYCKTEALARMAPMIAPIMHRIDLYMYYFFVPYRILWDGWEELITGGEDGNPTVAMPTMEISAELQPKSLHDYFNIPIPRTDDPTSFQCNVHKLNHYAYYEIWNEYFRDQNLQQEMDYENATPAQLSVLKNAAWKKDYFTSALPSAQRGPAILLPVESSFTPQYLERSEVHTVTGASAQPGALGVDVVGDPGLLSGNYDVSPYQARIENLEPTQTVDTTSITINDLRTSSRLQQWLELAMRGGARYREVLKNFFDSNVGDQRLDRPEYLGGGKTPITISEVLNTTGIETATGEPNAVGAPQGNMSGHGIAVGAQNTFKYHTKEHGVIMGLMCIRPKAAYQQGLHRMWTRRDRFDFPWVQFAHLGEQEVLNEELYFNFDNNTGNKEVFGYQQRFAEYKYSCDKVVGDFREQLEFWHDGRIFANQPNLNEEFITIDPADDELQRIFAVEDADVDKFYIQMYHNLKARRPLPFFSIPSLG